MFRTAQNRPARTRRNALRPRLDALEGRQLLTAGALDTSTFNTPNGFVLTPSNATGHNTQSGANAVTIGSGGKILAAGSFASTSNKTGYNFALVQYNPNGSLDTAFGSGGKVTTDFKGLDDGIADVVIQGDGKILAVGDADYGGVSGRTTTDNFDIALARYNPSGTLDTTFGSGGKVTTAISTTPSTTVSWKNDYDTARAVAIEPDGKILVAGTTYTASGLKFVLLRYNTNGVLDDTFGPVGSPGKVITSVSPGDNNAYGLTLQTVIVNGMPTTKILVAGSAPGASVVVRYNLDGSMDTTFGSGGVATLTTGMKFDIYNNNRIGGAIAVQPDQKIVIDGVASPTQTAPADRDLAVIRLNPDGSFDTTFNAKGPTPGVATIGLSAANNQACDVALQPDGKVLIAGAANYDGSSNWDTELARLNPDGTPDVTFGPNGNGLVVQSFVASNYESAESVALQADGKIVTAGGADTSNGGNLIVARFLNQAPTTTMLASSANPSVYGHSVTFTATVGTAGPLAPTGTVDFYDGATLLGSAVLTNVNGITTATFSISTLPSGTRKIRAIYQGDTDNMSSTSVDLSQVVN
jgi:uncharacterized delta-60 repeat protein